MMSKTNKTIKIRISTKNEQFNWIYSSGDSEIIIL